MLNKSQILENRKILLYGFLLSILNYLIISFSPDFFPKYQPDSQSYVDFSKMYNSVYPFLIDLLNRNFFIIVEFQKFFLAISLSFLFFCLFKIKVKLIFCLLFLILVNFNIYYTSYAKTILTESVFFSFMNFALGLLFIIDKKKKKYCSYFGICLGFIATIKSIGPIIVLSFLFLFIIKIKSFKFLFPVLISIFLLLIVENLIFFSKNSHRASVLGFSAIGKLSIISGKDSFVTNDYPSDFHPIIIKTKPVFKEINNFVDKIQNPILKAEILADYEAAAQYNNVAVSKFTTDEMEFMRNNYKVIFYHILKNNFFDYIEMSINHYIGMWSTGSKYIYRDFLKMFAPQKDALIKSSGPMLQLEKIILILSQIFFIFLFFIFLLVSLVILLKPRINFYLCSIVMISQIYLVIVSLLNIATIRYLMPVYPLIIISLIIILNMFFLRKNVKNKIK